MSIVNHGLYSLFHSLDIVSLIGIMHTGSFSNHPYPNLGWGQLRMFSIRGKSVDAGGTIAILAINDREETFVHIVIAEAFIATINGANIFGMELAL